jgi:hypothetical protein
VQELKFRLVGQKRSEQQSAEDRPRASDWTLARPGLRAGQPEPFRVRPGPMIRMPRPTMSWRAAWRFRAPRRAQLCTRMPNRPLRSELRVRKKSPSRGQKRRFGAENGEGGIRTRGRGLYPYDGLANRCLQPLGHLSKPSRNVVYPACPCPASG